jgi:clan AA aspartic protease (TIGR02281 family)
VDCKQQLTFLCGMGKMPVFLGTGSGKMRVIILVIIILAVLVSSSYGDTYKWVDEKGTVHFTDDLSSIPEKYREDAETRKPPQETSTPGPPEISKPSSPRAVKPTEPEGFEVKLERKHETWKAEVLLNGRVKRQFIVDTGASSCLIDWKTAEELEITIDENTPFFPSSTVSGIILEPYVVLKSMRVGNAELENVEVSIHDMPGGGGLLGNSFLNRFKVVIDSLNDKMTLYPLKGAPSPDRPGGYSRDYWEWQFRFYHRILGWLREIKIKYESKGARDELVRVNNSIRYFENQLSELDRKASFAGVPRNWRE